MTLTQVEKALEKRANRWKVEVSKEVMKAVKALKKEQDLIEKRLHSRIKSLENQVQKHQDKIFKKKI